MVILGIDVGGTSIKAALVDVATGRLASDRHQVPTPAGATPAGIAEAVGVVVRGFGWVGPIGCTLPTVVQGGRVRSAANVDPSWIGQDAVALFGAATGCQVAVVNDADAAGLAEMSFGAGRGRAGVVVMLTFGTGIGSALFVDGVLVPNTEFGHIQVGGVEAETRAAAVMREREALTWPVWAARVDTFLAALEAALWPDVIIVGGGVSAVAEKWVPLLHTRSEVVVAGFENDAGIVGAALVAQDRLGA